MKKFSVRTEPGLVDACIQCDNVMVFDSHSDYIEKEWERFERVAKCDHEKESHNGFWFCTGCGTPWSMIESWGES